MRPLTEAQLARARETAAKVRDLMPEIVPEIRALVEVGLIEGWRNVDYIGPHRPPGPRTFNLTQIVAESMTKTKERMKNAA